MASPNIQNGNTIQSNNFTDLEKLVKRLYQPGSPQEVSDIQIGLQNLQRSAGGWQFAIALLQSEDANVRFFGALTFTIKINKDWDSLTHADAELLLYRLVGRLIELIEAKETALVLRKLCSALIAYYLRPSIAWKQCIRYLVVCFKVGSPITLDQLGTEQSPTSSLIALLSESHLMATLWFAEGLVEEVNKVDAASIQTYKYFERVSSNIQDAVDLLHHSIQVNPSEVSDLAVQGVKCFQSWVMYAHRGWVDKGLELESLRPLTPVIMTTLQHEDMSECVNELFADLLNHFPAFLTADDFRHLAILLTTDDSRRVVTRLKGGGFDAETLSFARFLLAYGDAAVQDLAEKIDSPLLSQVLSHLLDLLNCDGYSGLEEEVCSQALEFWMTYTEFVIDTLFDDEEHRPAWIDVARQRIETIIEVCWVKIRMPPHEIAVNWDSDTRASFKNFRKDVHDLLQSSYTLLGVDIFGKLSELALQSLNNRAWLPLEATLFCLNALADSVADSESVDDMLSKLFGSSLFVDMTNPEESIPAKTRQTAVDTITRYTDFFERHTEHLPAMLNFLFEFLKSPALANAAAKAVFSACSSCRKSLTPELDAFLQQYELLLTWDTVDRNTKEKVMGAIAAIIQALPTNEDKLAPLTKLIESVEKDAANCKLLMEPSQAEELQETCTSALKCLVSMGKALQAPDDVINLDAEGPKSAFWTEGEGAPLQAKIIYILGTVTSLMKWNSDIVETGCQILRAGYKESTPGLFVFPIKVTVDFVLACGLNTARLDYVLGTAGVILVSRSSNRKGAMKDAALSFLNHMLGLIESMGYNHLSDPETSTGIIELANNMVPQQLESMMNTSNIQVLLDFIWQALTVAEIMPKRSAAHFWATFVQKYEISQDSADFVNAAMSRYGPLVCRVLVQRIAGEANRSELEELSEPLKRIIFSQPRAKTWLADALFMDQFPSQKVGPVEKRVWLQKILSLRGAKGTNQAVKDFWIQCRGLEFAYTS